MEIESVNCNLCGKDNAKVLYKTGDKIWLIGPDFNLVRCNFCGLSYVNPRPSPKAMAEFYPPQYFSRSFGAIKMTSEYKNEMTMIFQSRYRRFVRYKGSGSALEIGCGDGYFLEFLKKKGWGVFGVEPSLYACEYAKKNLGLDVFCGILDDFRAKAGSFDLIYMFEVLEHLHDPFLSLCKIKDMLNNDGVLVITVPNFSGLLRKLFGANWHFIDLPRHLFHFSRKTAQLILEKSGFRILSLESVSDINYLDSTIGYSESIRFWLRKRGFYPPKIIDSDQRKIPSALWKRILHRIEKIIYYPLVKISDMAGIGENLYICAKKK